LTYIATDSVTGSPREGYLEKILFGAEHHSLSDLYIEELEKWSCDTHKT